MSLKDIFSKDGRRERALNKACAKAVNSKIKPDDRRPALHQLFEDGSDQAIRALLRRFTFNYDTNMVSDEEEKEFVYESLLGFGERLLPPLREHLLEAATVSWGLRLLKTVAEPETTWNVIQEVLSRHEAGYERDPSVKLQLLSLVGNFDDPRVIDALLPYLEDHDETVRFTAVEGLLRHQDEKIREPLLKLMTDEDEESLRIRNLIAEGFIETGFSVKGYRGSVEKVLPPEYIVDGKGKIRRKRARK